MLFEEIDYIGNILKAMTSLLTKVKVWAISFEFTILGEISKSVETLFDERHSFYWRYFLSAFED